MRMLYRMMMKRLFQDKLMWITAVLALLLGIFTGWESSAQSGYESIYVQDFNLYLGQIFMSALLCFHFGQMYHDGTVRNILIAGYTRSQLYLATLFTAMTAGMIYLLLTAGTLALILIPAYSFLSAKIVAEAFLSIILSGLFSALLAAICCHLRRQQLAGVIACFCAVFGLYSLGEVTGQADRSDDGWYEEWVSDADGRPLFAENGEPLRIRRQRFYMKEPLHSVLMLLHRGNPILGMNALSVALQGSKDWTAAQRAEADTYAEKDMEARFPVTIPVMLLMTFGGLLLFRKRDVR